MQGTSIIIALRKINVIVVTVVIVVVVATVVVGVAATIINIVTSVPPGTEL